MATAAAARPMTAEEKKVIFASSLGTVLNGMTSTFTAHLPRLLPSNFSAVWMKAQPSFLRCWLLLLVLLFAPSAPFSLAVWET